MHRTAIHIFGINRRTDEIAVCPHNRDETNERRALSERRENSSGASTAMSRNFGLDVMRALAIILVLLSHTRFCLVGVFPEAKYMQLGGFWGVELFFVFAGLTAGAVLFSATIVSNREWWQRSVSALGIDPGSGLFFNISIITVGLVALTYARDLLDDLKLLTELQKKADQVYVDPALMEFAVRLVAATRKPGEYGLKELERYILFGASPRASINLILTAKALAFVRGRGYALPQEVQDMAYDVLRHRLVLSYEAFSDNVNTDDLLTRILDRIPIPVVPLHEHLDVRANS